ncbi:MAG: NifU family protein [Archaeoglobaceae archaeon]|nr:NifU family protein [Archaeoglobaceae archaeon]MDW7989477.1 NifU family protein [Archaeoglobaceae archaeon]
MVPKEKVVEVVEREIKPLLLRDGGSIEVVGVDEKSGTVQVKLLGACGACPMSMITLTAFVERVLRTKIPEVKRVVLV